MDEIENVIAEILPELQSLSAPSPTGQIPSGSGTHCPCCGAAISAPVPAVSTSLLLPPGNLEKELRAYVRRVYPQRPDGTFVALSDSMFCHQTHAHACAVFARRYACSEDDVAGRVKCYIWGVNSGVRKFHENHEGRRAYTRTAVEGRMAEARVWAERFGPAWEAGGLATVVAMLWCD